MIKSLSVIINLIGILSFGFLGGDIAVDMTTPDSVEAGKEFEVQLTLRKGSIESFSRVLQDLPYGLTATANITSNADFTFDDNKVRFIWLKLPAEEQVSISYKIFIDPRVKGTFNLGGKFSYIENNERKTIDLIARTITITPSPNVDPNLIVDINEFNKQQNLVASTNEEAPVACIRQKPSLATGNMNGYVVNLLVSKSDKEKFAKIEEQIPAGYTAVSIDSKTGIFSNDNGIAKFLWMTLPSESNFNVSYVLIPTDTSNRTAPVLTGQFSYISGDKTFVNDISQHDVNLANLSPDEMIALLATVKTTSTDLAINNKNTNTQNTNTQTQNTQTVQTKNTTVQQKVIRQSNPELPISYLLEPENGVYYRVQLAAGHKLVNVKRYFRKMNVTGDVRTEQHEGWVKYSIGSFREYKEARDYRSFIWDSSPIKDAFVLAYNTGARITVQEALMTTNQIWYK